MTKIVYRREPFHPDYGYPAQFRKMIVISYHRVGLKETLKKFSVCKSSIKSWAKHYDITEKDLRS